MMEDTKAKKPPTKPPTKGQQIRREELRQELKEAKELQKGRLAQRAEMKLTILEELKPKKPATGGNSPKGVAREPSSSQG